MTPLEQTTTSGRLNATRPGPRATAHHRVQVQGKSFVQNGKLLQVHGVTYGPFRPHPDHGEYGAPEQVDTDFAAMRRLSINVVRTYTLPPRWLLDCAHKHGLLVMVGLAWQQHTTFLDDKALAARILANARKEVQGCKSHPALFAISIGNEIPARIVRWHGRRRVEAFLKRLAQVVASEDPDALVTYVSYPTTEYLQLPFLDFVSFNVFLEQPKQLRNYLQRLQNQACDRPLLLTEIGLDSQRNGEDEQAQTLHWQIRTVLQGGAGAFVFKWTDEWHRGGCDIDDWSFGIVDKQRQPKPAYHAVQRAYAEPLLDAVKAPSITVVVCTYNGAATIRDCMEALTQLDYSNFDVLVVNDGSIDATAAIVAEYPFRRIDTDNGGLSRARNIGMRCATGEIVAYIDDDAFPEPDWLTHLALLFQSSNYVGIGGPNLPPNDDPEVAQCVANSPGGPSHVLFSDFVAEHLPGCNMAFRREAILAIDGFDEQFRIAGDDVDLCWRLQDNGGTLGFSPSAVVWHRRRSQTKQYLRQQYNYGRAEGMLYRKWPARYNRLGHMRWAGALYGTGHAPLQPGLQRVDQGLWGSRLFQVLYVNQPGSLWSLTMMPEWHLLIGLLLALTLVGLSWTPLLWIAGSLLLAAAAVPIMQAVRGACAARFARRSVSRGRRLRMRLTTAWLHLLQPIVRLRGRLATGLSPLRLRGNDSWAPPRQLRPTIWFEQWTEPMTLLADLEQTLRAQGALVRRGGNFDGFDFEIDAGLLGGCRLLSTVEEHGSGRQLYRFAIAPVLRRASLATTAIFSSLALAAGLSGATIGCVLLGGFAAAIALRTYRECSSSISSVQSTLEYIGAATTTTPSSNAIQP